MTCGWSSFKSPVTRPRPPMPSPVACGAAVLSSWGQLPINMTWKFKISTVNFYLFVVFKLLQKIEPNNKRSDCSFML